MDHEQGRDRRARFYKVRQNAAGHSYLSMKVSADQRRTAITFSPGDLLLLRLQPPYRQLSLGRGSQQKLSLRFYGPFRISPCIGPVAYELDRG